MIGSPIIPPNSPRTPPTRRERTLHTPIPLGTTPPQRRTATSHITNLRPLTLHIRTIRTLHTTLPLKSIELLHQRDIPLHRLRHRVPIRRVEWGVGGPAGDIVGVAGGVFELVNGTGRGGVEVGEGGDVRVPSVGVVDFEVAGVDFVHSEAAVEIRQGGYAGADPAGGEGIGARLLGAVVGVVDHDFVFVRVPEEDVGDYVWGVAVDDLVEEVGGVWEWVGAVPAC